MFSQPKSPPGVYCMLATLVPTFVMMYGVGEAVTPTVMLLVPWHMRHVDDWSLPCSRNAGTALVHGALTVERILPLPALCMTWQPSQAATPPA